MATDPVKAVLGSASSVDEKVTGLRKLGLKLMEQSRHQHKVWAGELLAKQLTMSRCETCGDTFVSDGAPDICRCENCLYATSAQVRVEIDKLCETVARRG